MTKEESHSIRTLCLNCTKHKTCQFLCDALDTIIQALQERDAKQKETTGESCRAADVVDEYCSRMPTDKDLSNMIHIATDYEYELKALLDDCDKINKEDKNND